MNRKSFYVITFLSMDSNKEEASRTFETIRIARKWAEDYKRYAQNVRIMKGGPGGMEVQ
jgi:lysozyme family protein